MTDMKIFDFSKNIFEMSEDTIYNVIEKLKNNQTVDRALTYVYIKAFYIHIVKIYMFNKNKLEKFDKIILEYRNIISTYYKNNNIQISKELLEDILNAFDKSFEIIESLSYNDLDDGYEFRHHVITAFELLRQILEKKSKTNIRTDIFENSISEIRNQSEKILDFVQKCNIIE